jgi:hypothetical protein
VDQALTRNEVAQLVLNALESNVKVVTEQGGVNVSTGDVAVSVQATYDEKNVVNNSYNYDATNANGVGTQQLCEKLYGRDLVKNAASTDDMGRPTTNWSYLGTKVESTQTADVTYTNAVALKDIYSALNMTSAQDVWIYLNGDDTQAVKVTLGEKNGKCEIKSGTAIGVKTDDDGTLKIGGKGYTLEFFVADDDDRTVTAIAYTEFLAKATADYNESDESVAIEVYSGLAVASDVGKLESDDFDGLESIKDGDYLLITAALVNGEYEVQSYSFPEIVSNVTVTGWKDGKTIVANGTTYSYDVYAVANHGTSMFKNDNGMLNEDYDLYLNSNGYVIGVDTASDSVSLDNYLFVTAKDESAFSYIAKVVFMDGTDATITVNKVDGNKVSSIYDYSVDTFYTFTVRSDGKYDLKPTKGAQLSYVVSAADRTTEIASGDTTPFNNTYYATADTVYVHDDKVSIGVKNSPAFKVSTADYTVYYLIDEDDDSLIKAVYCEKKGSSTASSDTEYVYLLGIDTTNVDSNDVTYYTFNAIVKGAKTTIDVSDDIVGDTSAPKGLYEITGYTDGYADLDIVSVDEYDEIKLGGVLDNLDKDKISYKSGTARFDTEAYTLTDSTVIYLIDGVKDNKLSTLSGGQLSSLASGTYRVIVILESTKDNASAETIYVVRMSNP